ncbi:MAG: S-layer homology domain-containing protein [Clostridia bacterium]|nr:S-layer homology domain-containing protein [Clostridia bacterium]
MKIKKALCLLLSLVMILAMAPSAIFSAEENETTEEIKVYMTVVNKDVIASDNDGNIMANRELTVSDIDEDGKFTFHEALIAAHKEYNSEEGYDAGSGNGVSVVKLWGIDSYNNLFFINDVGIPGGVGSDEVKDGDFLTTSICQDSKYYGDRYTFFDKKEVTAIENEEFTLKIKGFWGMASEGDDLLPKPFEGLSLCTWEDGELKEIEGKVTDEDGNVNLSFSEAGTYYVTAKGTVKAMVTDWWTMKEVEAECPIIAPLCKVVVGNSEGGSGDNESDEDDEEDEGGSLEPSLLKLFTAEVEGDIYPDFAPDVYSYSIIGEYGASPPIMIFKTDKEALVKVNGEEKESNDGVYEVKLSDELNEISLYGEDESDATVYKFYYVSKVSPLVPDKVVEAVYIGGQYQGTYDASPELTLGGVLGSLGNFGGYITYYYEEPITDNPNNMYGVDLYVFGNGYETDDASMAEPGQVYVSEDGETWYALAGSEHYEDKALWDYEITYKKGEDGKAYWTDNYGNEMLTSAAKAWPAKEKYPLNPFAEDDTYTFKGVLLKERGGSITGDGTNGSLSALTSFGYVDYYAGGTLENGMASDVNPYVEKPTKSNGFDIAWAVDGAGNPVDVSGKEFHYVKVTTASNIWTGTFGEKSAEVSLVVKTNQKDDIVGKTETPESIVITDGTKEINVELAEGKNIYNVDTGDMKNISVKIPSAKDDDNIYINNKRITNKDSADGFAVTKESETLIRVIVQNGEKEPYIVLLKLTGSAEKIEALVEGIDVYADGKIKKAETKDGKSYKLTVGSKVSKVSINPIAKYGTVFTVNGEELALDYELSYGKNTFVISVEYEGKTENVELNITREKKSSSSAESDGKISVSLTLYGDEVHGEGEEHTYTKNKKELPVWITKTSYKVDKGTTVLELLETALEASDYTWTNETGDYISEINGLHEMDNGALSGWIYNVNGKYPNKGMSDYKVKNGDKIVVHYTDDFTKEKDAVKGTSSVTSSKDKKEEEKKPEKEKREFSKDTFSDVSEESPYFEAIKFVYENSLMNGSDKGFEPEGKITRAMLVTVLYRFSNEKAVMKYSFDDVSPSAWYAESVSWATEKGIVNGVGNGRFNPEEFITREQMATVIFRYLKNEGYIFETSDEIDSYTDFGEISSWAKEAFSYAVNKGIVKTTENNELLPKEAASRAEAAYIIMGLPEVSKVIKE